MTSDFYRPIIFTIVVMLLSLFLTSNSTGGIQVTVEQPRSDYVTYVTCAPFRKHLIWVRTGRLVPSLRSEHIRYFDK